MKLDWILLILITIAAIAVFVHERHGDKILAPPPGRPAVVDSFTVTPRDTVVMLNPHLRLRITFTH